MADGGENTEQRPALTSGRDAALGDRFKIRASQTVVDMASPAAEAFVAIDSTAPDTTCVALVARPEQLPRISSCTQIKGLDQLGVMRLYDHGSVDWPDGTRRYAMVYEAPAGPPLLRRDASIEPIAVATLIRSFIRPAVQALTEFARRGVSHRAIRPDNVFWYDFGKSRLMLGPNTAGPAGARQPAQFETIEMAICNPFGRGPGSSADDIFSLGATVLALAMGRWPMAEADDATVVQRRLSVGTWDALAGKFNPPGDLFDFLRGALSDDPAERWSLATIGKWIDGARPALPRFTEIAKARDPFMFEARAYRSSREIALALAANPAQAASAVRSGTLGEWAGRSLPDDDAVRRIAAVSGADNPAARDGDPVLVARACLALDPTGPIHISGTSAHPDGLGSALAHAFLSRRDSLPAFDALMRAGLHLEWHAAQEALQRKPSTRPRRKHAALERLSRWAVDASPGSGLERCLYEIDSSLPCLSPGCIDQWVDEPGKVLPAIDASAADGANSGFDRHIAAFLSARGAADEKALRGLMDTGASEEERLTALRLLATLQESHMVGGLPNLAAQCAALVRPTVDKFQRVTTKQMVAQRSEEAVAQGDLKSLLGIVDDRAALDADARDFSAAKLEYSTAAERLSKSDLLMLDRMRQAIHRGRETAVLASGALSLATFFAILALHLR
jgi:hypothetical protein